MSDYRPPLKKAVKPEIFFSLKRGRVPDSSQQRNFRLNRFRSVGRVRWVLPFITVFFVKIVHKKKLFMIIQSNSLVYLHIVTFSGSGHLFITDFH